jgi:uncharacterized protein
MNLANWETKFEDKIREVASAEDPAHDLLHFKRVVGLAKQLCEREGGRPEVVVPAAWLHDLVIVPKDSPLRSQASRLSAEKAVEFLRSIAYPEIHMNDIAHAVEGHSFSANIEVKTLEANGIARCFATAGLLKRPFYNPEDPFCEVRPADDAKFTVDHFYKKLFKTAETLKTQAGLEEGRRRVEVMKMYLSSLSSEI